MNQDNSHGPATGIIHNRHHRDSFGSPYSPVYNTTTYQFENTDALLDVIEGRAPGHLNTFASPINQQPLELGADLVLHSATKYLGGHSDLTAGALMTKAELAAAVVPWRKNLGQLLAPETAGLLSRSLRTLPVRIRQHNENAMAVAQAMAQHPRVRRVLYPGLPGFTDHELAARQMKGFGGMVTIEVDGDRAASTAVADNLRLFLLATSLGGVESLVSQPCATSHHGLSQEERLKRGITDGMLRLSIGLEDSEDLIADLNQALDQAFG